MKSFAVLVIGLAEVAFWAACDEHEHSAAEGKARATPLSVEHLIRRSDLLSAPQFFATVEVRMPDDLGKLELSPDNVNEMVFTTKASMCPGFRDFVEPTLPNDTAVSCRDIESGQVIWRIVRDQAPSPVETKHLPRLTKPLVTAEKFSEELVAGQMNHRFIGVAALGANADNFAVTATKQRCDELEPAMESSMPNGMTVACFADGNLAWKLDRAH
ncbi:MAG TPA: hypothetical protein VGG74_11890 [Kofleriaceae bacterium]|jgi:hypothetical protein